MQIGLHSAIEHLKLCVWTAWRICSWVEKFKPLLNCYSGGGRLGNVHSNVKRSYLTSGRSIRRPEIELFLACPNFSRILPLFRRYLKQLAERKPCSCGVATALKKKCQIFCFSSVECYAAYLAGWAAILDVAGCAQTQTQGFLKLTFIRISSKSS